MKSIRLAPFQLFLLLVFVQLGISIFSMPLSLYEKTNRHAWIPVICCGVGSQLSLACIWYVGSKLKATSVGRVFPLLFGPLVGKLVNLAFTGYFLWIATFLIDFWIRVSKLWIYFYTPPWVFAVGLTGLALYLVRGGLGAISRYAPVCLLGFLLFLFLLGSTVPEFEPARLLPVGYVDLGAIGQGTLIASPAMIGFEILWFLQPYMSVSSRKAFWSAFAANTTTVLFTAIVMISTIMFFGDREYSLVSHPILYQLKSQAFIVVERTDLFILTLWISNIVLSAALFLWIASELVRHVAPALPERGAHYGAAAVLAVAVLVLRMLRMNEEAKSAVIQYMGIVMGYAFPLAGLAVYKIKKRFGVER